MNVTAPLTFGQASVINAFQQLPREYHAERNIARLWALPPLRTVGRVRDALAILADRHESLRTRFDLADGRQLQVVDPVGDLPIHERLSKGGTGDVSAALLELWDGTFDLDRQYGWRGAVLVDDRGAPHHLAVCLHHALVDWYGVDQLGCDFAALVGDDQPARQQVLNRPILRPRELAMAQHSVQWRERRKRSLIHWQRTLDEIGCSEPPSTRTPGRVDVHLRSVKMWRSLQVAVQRCRVSTQSILLALTSIVVGSVADTHLPVLELTVSNRHDHHWRAAVATLVQAMLLPVQLQPTSQSFVQLAHSVHRRALACMRHGFFDPDELAALLAARGAQAPVADYQFNLMPSSSMVGRRRPPLEHIVSVEPRYRIGPRLRVWAVTRDDLEIIIRTDPSLVPESAAQQILRWFHDEIARLADEPTPHVQELMARLDLSHPR